MMMMALKDGGSAKAVIGELVRNEVFRMIKFISEVEQLAYDAEIARYVAGKMGIEPENLQFRELWRAQRKNVKKTLDSKRSTTSMAVKRVFISKYCAVRVLVGTKPEQRTNLIHLLPTPFFRTPQRRRVVRTARVPRNEEKWKGI